nr:rifin PIR protein,putative [Plasmodium sp. DRC-Itaito]
MQNFNKQTKKRFHEYDKRMIEKRKCCKDQCDKEIQKIILKDKLEKELMDKFVTLQTDIQNDAIRTCICEILLADKIEKCCLTCEVNVGGGVTLSSGVLGGIGALAEMRDSSGIKVVIAGLRAMGMEEFCPKIFNSFGTTIYYTYVTKIANAYIAEHKKICVVTATGDNPMCLPFDMKIGVRLVIDKYGTPANDVIPETLNGILADSETAAKTATDNVIAVMTKKQITLIEARFDIYI